MPALAACCARELAVDAVLSLAARKAKPVIVSSIGQDYGGRHISLQEQWVKPTRLISRDVRYGREKVCEKRHAIDGNKHNTWAMVQHLSASYARCTNFRSANESMVEEWR